MPSCCCSATDGSSGRERYAADHLFSPSGQHSGVDTCKALLLLAEAAERHTTVCQQFIALSNPKTSVSERFSLPRRRRRTR